MNFGVMRALARGESEETIAKRGGSVVIAQIDELEKQLLRLRKMAEYVAKTGIRHQHDDRAWRATGKAVDALFVGFENA